MSSHHDRHRARAFGSAADDYDRHRPRYPRTLIDGLVATGNQDRVLGVGAGTGIASVQLRDRGAWGDMVTTYSNALTLTPHARSGLRAALRALIGTAGVEAENAATAVVCGPPTRETF